jgi:hypothetical protein
MVLVSLLQHINLYLIDDTVLYGQRYFQCLSLDVVLILNAWLNTTPSLAHSKLMVWVGCRNFSMFGWVHEHSNGAN